MKRHIFFLIVSLYSGVIACENMQPLSPVHQELAHNLPEVPLSVMQKELAKSQNIRSDVLILSSAILDHKANPSPEKDKKIDGLIQMIKISYPEMTPAEWIEKMPDACSALEAQRRLTSRKWYNGSIATHIYSLGTGFFACFVGLFIKGVVDKLKGSG